MTENVTPTPDPTPAPTPAPEGGSPTPAEKMLSQSAVDEIVRDRLDRQKRSILGNLGVDTLETAQAAIEEARTLKAAQMTEAERVAAELEAERTARTRAEEALAAKNRTDAQRALLLAEGFDAQAAEKLAGKLAGDDEAAWKADAAEYKSLIKAGGPAPLPADHPANSLALPENPMAEYEEARKNGDVARMVELKTQMAQT